MRCKRCGFAGRAGEAYCRRCGTLAEGISARCDQHAGLEATGACVVCGRPLCSECGIREGEGWYCEENRHAVFAAEYAPLGTAPTIFEAEALLVNLRSAGIRCEVIERKRYLALLEDPPPKGAVLYVLRPEIERARTAVADFGLQEFLDEGIRP